MKLELIFYILTLILFVSCEATNKHQEEKDKVDPFESAVPHGESLVPQELSEEDQLKLINAKGRQVNIISLDELKTLMRTSSSKVQILNFWKLDNKECLYLSKNFQKIQTELGERSVQQVLINMDTKENIDGINSYIRSNNIVAPVYQIEVDSLFDWHGEIQSNWNGELPAFVLSKPEEKVNLFYQQSFNYDEIMALIQPFVIN